MPNFENNVFVSNEKENQESLQKNVDEQMEVIPNKEERHKLKNEQEIALEEQKLEAFVKVMSGEEYYIAGGLAQEIDKGQIEHRHEDVDIIIFKDQEERIIENLKKHGFEVIRKPKFTGHDLDAMNFEVNVENGEWGEGPERDPRLYIGIFEYVRDKETNVARRLEEDGAADTVFPLSYFDREKQTLDYKTNKVTVADLRLVASSKLISEKPKDLQDVKDMLPILKERYSESEIDELKNISKENIKTRVISGLKYLFERFEKSDMEVNTDNIVEYFCSETEESLKKAKDEDYAKAGREFLERIKNFSSLSNDPKTIKKEFMDFIIDNFEPIDGYYNKIIDKAFEGGSKEYLETSLG